MKKVLYILGALTDEDAEWMAQSGERRTLAPGQVLIHEGQSPGAISIILDGQFSVSVGSAEVARVGTGEIMGEVSFVDRQPATATVTATMPSRVLVLKHAVVRERIRTDPNFSSRFYLAISTFLADRLRVTLLLLDGRRSADTGNDELDLDSLDSVSRAGARFDRILQQLREV